MPNPYDLALRQRAVTAYERGDGSSAQLAAPFDVDHRTLERWVARWRDTQSLAPQAACTAGNHAYCNLPRSPRDSLKNRAQSPQGAGAEAALAYDPYSSDVRL